MKASPLIRHFDNAAASVAQLYDALHKPEMPDSLFDAEPGSDGYTHKFFRVAEKVPTTCATTRRHG
ncbi:hypothetical protein ACNKHV_27435 [Shigella flexneri]